MLPNSIKDFFTTVLEIVGGRYNGYKYSVWIMFSTFNVLKALGSVIRGGLSFHFCSNQTRFWPSLELYVDVPSLQYGFLQLEEDEGQLSRIDTFL